MNGAEKRWNIWCVLAMIALAIPPILLIMIGCKELARGMLVREQAAFFFLAVPVLALTGYFMTLRSRRSGCIKLLLCVLIAAVYFGAAFYWTFLGEYEIL